MKKPQLPYPLPEPLKQKFVEMLGSQPEGDKCWIWPKCTPEGYPYFCCNGTQYSAAEVSHLVHIGAVPPGLNVLRTCGNHSCVNPAHLRAGKPNATRDDTRRRRFLAKTTRDTEIKPGMEKPCLLWNAAMKAGIYGLAHFQGKRVRATHVAWYLETGEIVPEGKIIMHKCDNPPCVEPSHLCIGTTQDNVDDRNQKGRTASGDRHGTHRKPRSVRRGENHGRHVLTEEEVVLIRRTYDTYPDERGCVEWLARHLGRKRYAVWCVATRKTWRHVPEDARPEIGPVPLDVLKEYASKNYSKGEKHHGCKLCDRQVREIRFLAQQNAGNRGTVSALAARYDVSRRLIRAIVAGKKRVDVPDDFESLGLVEPLNFTH